MSLFFYFLYGQFLQPVWQQTGFSIFKYSFVNTLILMPSTSFQWKSTPSIKSSICSLLWSHIFYILSSSSFFKSLLVRDGIPYLFTFSITESIVRFSSRYSSMTRLCTRCLPKITSSVMSSTYLFLFSENPILSKIPSVSDPMMYIPSIDPLSIWSMTPNIFFGFLSCIDAISDSACSYPILYILFIFICILVL